MKNVDFGLTEMGGYRQVALRAKKFLINDPIASAFGNSGSSGRLFADSIDAILGKDFSIEAKLTPLWIARRTPRRFPAHYQCRRWPL